MNKKKYKPITNLIVASLMSEGELFSIDGNVPQLLVPYCKEKSFYLFSYIKNYSLEDYIEVKPKKSQFKIVLSDDLLEIVQQWYINGNKIFSKKISSAYMTFDSVITCINLFGLRRIEGIGIPTTISKDYLKTLSYCFEKMLKINVFVGNYQIKIPEVHLFFNEITNQITTLDSSELANFLTNQDKNKLVEEHFKGDWNDE